MKKVTSEKLIANGWPERMVNSEDVAAIWYHTNGFVANSYKWPAPGLREIATRIDGENWELSNTMYDRKRSYGSGHKYAAKSVRGGNLSKYNN